MGSNGSYPQTLVDNYMTEKAEVHNKAVHAYADMIKARRAAEQKAREDKIAERLRKKAEKAAEKKRQEVARLREEIKEKYVDKAVPVEEILKQEITEIDGWAQDSKAVITALGGWLGQLMIVLNTIAKYYP